MRILGKSLPGSGQKLQEKHILATKPGQLEKKNELSNRFFQVRGEGQNSHARAQKTHDGGPCRTAQRLSRDCPYAHELQRKQLHKCT